MISFTARLCDVETKNTKSLTSYSKKERLAQVKLSSMILDGEEIKVGDKFHLLQEDGTFASAIFKGAYNSITDISELGRDCKKIMYRLPEISSKTEILSNISDGNRQLFSLNGLIALQARIGQLLKQAK